MDVVSPLTFSDLTLRLVVAVILGAAVGFDRELQNKPAGFRTHAMVALGAALMCVISLGFPGSQAQVLQGIIVGIGFVGGGAILRRDDQPDVSGLTTATSVWVVAAMGCAAGVGFWKPALLTAFLALVILRGGGIAMAAMARWRRRRGDRPTTSA